MNTQVILNTLSEIEEKFIRRRLFEPFNLYTDVRTIDDEGALKVLYWKELVQKYEEYFIFTDETTKYFMDKYFKEYKGFDTQKDTKDLYIEYLLDRLKKYEENE